MPTIGRGNAPCVLADAPSLEPLVRMDDHPQRRKLWPRREDDPFAQLAHLRAEYQVLLVRTEYRDREIARLVALLNQKWSDASEAG